MANTLDPMASEQIISLHPDGFSNRKIAAILRISCNAVNMDTPEHVGPSAEGRLGHFHSGGC